MKTNLIARCVAVVTLCCFAGVLIGCDAGTATKNNIVGNWEIDTETMLKEMEEETTTDEDKAGMAFAKGMISAMKIEMEFTEDGKAIMSTSMMGNAQTDELTYKVKSNSGDEMLIMLSGKDEESGEMKDEEMKIKFVDKDTIEMQPTDEEAKKTGPEKMILKRKTE